MGLKRPQYTQVPNHLIDVLMVDMSLSELKVILLLVRKIIGFHRPNDYAERLGYEEIGKLVGISGRSAQSALAALEKAGLVLRVEHGAGKKDSYALLFEEDNEDGTQEKISDPKESDEKREGDPRKNFRGTQEKISSVYESTQEKISTPSPHKESTKEKEKEIPMPNATKKRKRAKVETELSSLGYHVGRALLTLGKESKRWAETKRKQSNEVAEAILEEWSDFNDSDLYQFVKDWDADPDFGDSGFGLHKPTHPDTVVRNLRLWKEGRIGKKREDSSIFAGWS